MTAAMPELNYKINSRELAKDQNDYCRWNYRNIEYFFVQKTIIFSSALYFKDNALNKGITATFAKILPASRPVSQCFSNCPYFNSEFRSYCVTDDWIQVKQADWGLVFSFPIPRLSTFPVIKFKIISIELFHIWKNENLRYPLVTKAC